MCLYSAASGTETLAIPQSDGSYKLYGYKWFTSATDSDVAVTLARIVDHNGISIDVSIGGIMTDDLHADHCDNAEKLCESTKRYPCFVVQSH